MMQLLPITQKGLLGQHYIKQIIISVHIIGIMFSPVYLITFLNFTFVVAF